MKKYLNKILNKNYIKFNIFLYVTSILIVKKLNKRLKYILIIKYLTHLLFLIVIYRY